MIQVDDFIMNYPVVQYQLLNSADIVFTEKVRTICKEECPRYGKSWSCPPGVGEVQECKERCLKYPQVLVFTTMAEVSDASIMEETLATRSSHEEITRAIMEELHQRGYECLALSSESCQACASCAYPEPCRNPEYMIPCIESFGILVTDIAEKCGIEFYTDMHTVTWFGLIFIR